jgi:nicotinate-nucleotide pyrophosphorylase
MYEALHELVRRALAEDGAEADITTLSTVPAEQQARGTILTRQEGVVRNDFALRTH